MVGREQSRKPAEEANIRAFNEVKTFIENVVRQVESAEAVKRPEVERKLLNSPQRKTAEGMMLGWLSQKNFGPVAGLVYFATHSQSPYAVELTAGLLINAASADQEGKAKDFLVESLAKAGGTTGLARIERAILKLPQTGSYLSKQLTNESADAMVKEIEISRRRAEPDRVREIQPKTLQASKGVKPAALTAGKMASLPEYKFGLVLNSTEVATLRQAGLAYSQDPYVPLLRDLLTRSKSEDALKTFGEQLHKANERNAMRQYLLLLKEAAHQGCREEAFNAREGKAVSEYDIFRSVMKIILGKEEASPRCKAVRDEFGGTVLANLRELSRKDYFIARAAAGFMLPPATGERLRGAKGKAYLEGDYSGFPMLFETLKRDDLFFTLIRLGDVARELSENSGRSVADELQQIVRPSKERLVLISPVIKDCAAYGGAYAILWETILHKEKS